MKLKRLAALTSLLSVMSCGVEQEKSGVYGVGEKFVVFGMGQHTAFPNGGVQHLSKGKVTAVEVRKHSKPWPNDSDATVFIKTTEEVPCETRVEGPAVITFDTNGNVSTIRTSAAQIRVCNRNQYAKYSLGGWAAAEMSATYIEFYDYGSPRLAEVSKVSLAFVKPGKDVQRAAYFKPGLFEFNAGGFLKRGVLDEDSFVLDESDDVQSAKAGDVVEFNEFGQVTKLINR